MMQFHTFFGPGGVIRDVTIQYEVLDNFGTYPDPLEYQ